MRKVRQMHESILTDFSHIVTFLYQPIPNSSTSKIKVEKAGIPAQAFEP